MATQLREIERTPLEKAPEPELRGDPIPGSRYTSREFMALEWEHLWTKIWQPGGLVPEIPEPGDYVTCEIGPESIIMVRQHDRTIKAFYNVCHHRAARLVFNEVDSVEAFICPYHGWRWELDGALTKVRDPEDFPEGDPCGKLRLTEIPCETWGGFIWFNMNPDCGPLADFLAPVAEQLEPYQLDNMTRVMYMTAEAPCNWKIIEDNFSESYHLQTIHPELKAHIEERYIDTQFDLYESGHNRMLMKGNAPSLSFGNDDEIAEPLRSIVKGWDIDPDDFKGRARDIRKALQAQKRKLGPERGYHHYDSLQDDQLTDYFHYTLFPNLSLTMSSEGFQVLWPKPHPTDPAKCIFHHWFLVPNQPCFTDADEVAAADGMRPFGVADHEIFNYGDQSLGPVADQDLAIIGGQQLGLRSRAFKNPYFSGQERRVRRFHEVLNDYIEGRRSC